MTKKFIVEVDNDCEGLEAIKSLLYLGRRSDETPSDLADIEVFEVTEVPQVTNGRMTFEQREKLWEMCGRYGVPFREDDYHPTQFSSNSPIMYEGWIGGIKHSGPIPGHTERKRTIYVGVEPDGRSHT